ncbi:DUF1120 domain-containing protein [Erwinia sp. MYb375]|uniref:DUF1120 domain-containing protein n=2 Tax=Erwinia TaxID=551 RepID=UPI0030AA7B59
MKKITTLAALIIGVIASGQALAGGSATLSLKGNILPGGCEITLPSAALEWKDIDISSMSPSKMNDLPVKNVTLSVNCQAKMNFAIKASDNNVAKLPEGIQQSLAKNYFSFGSDGVGGPAGAYTIKALVNGSSADKDKASAFVTYKDSAWDQKLTSTDFAYFINTRLGDKDAVLDMSTTSGITSYLRSSAKSKVFALEIAPSLGPVTGQALAGNFDLSGSTTFEVIYM